MRRAYRLVIAYLVLSATWSPADAGSPRIVGRSVLDFTHAGPPPMHLPSAVTVAVDGVVYVADGINDRILQFAPNGEFSGAITQVGSESLARPMSARLDSAGRLWIADTGNQRVLVRGPDGTAVMTFVAAETKGYATPDVTDVLVTPDGRLAWLVDNDNAWLTRVQIDTKLEARVGGRGEALGQFQYPYMAALGPEGDVFVTDVINGRVVQLDVTGQPVRTLGSYGLQPGQFYRPVGVACDRRGNVWVSDCVLGVIQAFTKDGAFIDVLRDDMGKPLRFEAPIGLTFDEAGNLYVVEQRADRVRKLSLEIAEEAGGVFPPPPRASLVSPQPRACTACHFEWMSPFETGSGTELADPPNNPPKHPSVSRSETCLSCHNGAVVDSRRTVWTAHGHQTGIKPPEGMKVPDRLPLIDGQLACRTCHSAHTRGGSGNLMKDAVFLRVSKSPLDLCTACHAGFDGGVETAMHPVGPMPIPTPAEFLHGAVGDGAGGEVTCLVCHQAHGSGRTDLLALNIDSNTLCLTCHSKLAPALFGDETRSQHGRMPQLAPEQKAVATALSQWIGPDDRLLCMTCHASHRARTTRYLLVSKTLRADACAECHASQDGVAGSPHDLRSAPPVATSAAASEPAESSVCGECHTAHRFARTPLPAELDATGQCTTCHADGRPAASKQLGPLNHPSAPCASCHDPHETKFADFLAGPPAERCVTCHADHAGLRGGVHDLAQDSPAWPAAARAANDLCLACHRPHGTEATGLFRVAWKDGPHALDAACLACHEDTAASESGPRTFLHPRVGDKLTDSTRLPTVASADGRKQIACQTCHDPHAGGSGAAKLLRLEPNTAPADLCLACHQEMLNINTIGHSAASLRMAGFEADACRPCHQVHANPTAVEGALMFPKELTAAAPASTQAASAVIRVCTSCHRENGPAAPPEIATHPPADFYNPEPPDAAGYLPLFDAAGQVDPRGSITCRTCHLTHGRTTPAPESWDPQTVGPRELRARKWSLRTFGPASVCNTCHGFDALRRFLYFHKPAGRTKAEP